MTEKNKDEVARRYLLLLKLDIKNLFRRLASRKNEYIMIFALKRSREHFNTVFASRYEQAGFDELAYCSEETITALDQFYSHVEEIKWYLDYTEDMPNMVEDELSRMFHKLEEYYNTSTLYIDAELGVKSAPEMISEFSLSKVTSEQASDDESAQTSDVEVEQEFGENPWPETKESNEDN
jgi:hypothetical protein